MKKALIFIANGSEEIETLSPLDYLRRAGVDVTLAAVGGKVATAGDKPWVECSHKVKIMADADILEIDGSSFDAVIVPGGMPGAVNLASSNKVIDILKAQDKAGKLVCAICAAPALVLSKSGALEGKKWTCYPGMESEAKSYEAAYQSGVAFVHDKNVITGRGPGAAEEWSMEIVRTLCGEETARLVHDKAVQR